jgi:hypothetical protein
VTENTVVESGFSGIVVGGNGGVSNIRIRNNIFAFNSQYGVARDSTCPTNSVADTNVLFGNGSGAVQGGCSGLNTSGGNHLTDPLFVNRTGGDLHVQAGSPAIDFARADYSLPADFDGRSRPQGARAGHGGHRTPRRSDGNGGRPGGCAARERVVAGVEAPAAPIGHGNGEREEDRAGDDRKRAASSRRIRQETRRRR